MLQVGLKNFDLVKYLVSELLASRDKKMAALREFMPTAKDRDWELITAGQRVQVMKKDPEKGGVLQFGTEVITGADGTIAGLLGASPGASTAAPIMLDVLARCFPDRFVGWEPRLRQMIPSFGRELSSDPAAAEASLTETAKALELTATHAHLRGIPRRDPDRGFRARRSWIGSETWLRGTTSAIVVPAMK